ncbi:putative cyclin D [Rosa chinensis]|uniref:B-like cyclin n=1 Tax=Rosa chinensis TaxID=74649 RepID=A0A2P6Q0P3_ROSCH|nr:cyclin-D3-3 [Rosa chinensis]PRQ27767.1 putative cyclin D [Rosa chinensis]
MDPPFLLDALFCSEQRLDEEEQEATVLDYSEEFVEDSSFYSNNSSSCKQQQQPIKSPILLEQDLFWDDEELTSLLSKEKLNQDRKILNPNSSLAGARKEAVDWMLRVNAHYSFSALTAVLAVDYLDRFFFSFQFQTEKPWMTQLAAVACISLAAKVEETQVPLLLDFQVEDSKYVFEAKTINRMEILVLSTLDWKMNPVTPISFLDYMTRRFGLKDHLCWEFLKRCELIIVNLISDSRFLSFLPSVVATATMLHVVNNIEPCLQVEYENQLLTILGIDKGLADDCSKLIMELSSSWSRNKRKFGYSIPGSPNGVIDISFSSDSSNDSWAVASSVSSSPEPLSKKSRALEKQLLEKLNQTANAAADILSLPRLP